MTPVTALHRVSVQGSRNTFSSPKIARLHSGIDLLCLKGLSHLEILAEGWRAVRTPSRMTASDFSDSLKYFIQHNCVVNRRSLCCAICGSPIMYVRAALWIHATTCPGCGNANDWSCHVMVPYCPRCEEKPAERGCLYPAHVAACATASAA